MAGGIDDQAGVLDGGREIQAGFAFHQQRAAGLVIAQRKVLDGGFHPLDPAQGFDDTGVPLAIVGQDLHWFQPVGSS